MAAFLLVYLPLVLVPLVLLIPAWIVSRGREDRDALVLPFVHVPAVTLWAGIVAAGMGAQSLGNLVEGFILGGVAILLGYLKILVVDQFTSRHRATTYGLAALLLVLAVALRSLMPIIPE
jgi:hypothetical protein